MATSSSAIFKGSSAYSNDFAAVITRAVAIASLPIQIMTDGKTKLTAASDEFTKLDTKFTALQTAIAKVGTALGGASYLTEVSADKIVGVSVTEGAHEGVYSIDVKSIGAYETSLSTQNWNVPADPSGGLTTFKLVVGNQSYDITPADANNSVQSVVDAINKKYGAMVQATTVNVASGDTRISLQSATLEATNLDIFQIPTGAVPSSLQTQAATGYSNSRTTATWDASGAPSEYTLSVGGVDYVIAPGTGNTASEVADAINANYGGLVRASVVDLNTGGLPDLRISLQSVADGAPVLDLKRTGGLSLQTAQASATSRTTASWVADAAGTRSTYKLMIGGIENSFTPKDSSAATVAATINSLYGSQVNASVVNFGTTLAPDYRIALQNKTGSATTLDLVRTTGSNFQVEKTVGAPASYEMNRSGVTSSSTTRSIIISTGITATLQGLSGIKPTDITVTRSTSILGTALSALGDAYNAAVDELATQRGSSTGALRGNSIVSQLSSLLGSVATYSQEGQGLVLKDMGLELGKDGHLTFTQNDLFLTDLKNSTGVASFLGSANGGGFLKFAADALNSVEAAGTGLLKTAASQTIFQITRLAATIAAKQAQVDQLQLRMQSQMAASDALIAAMQQKASFFTSMFAAQQTASQMNK